MNSVWHLLQTKPRQERVALTHLKRHGYPCYLPQMCVERLRRKKLILVTEPMFPRYLLILLDSSE